MKGEREMRREREMGNDRHGERGRERERYILRERVHATLEIKRFDLVASARFSRACFASVRCSQLLTFASVHSSGVPRRERIHICILIHLSLHCPGVKSSIKAA
eukprot:5707064-Pyramimonas_sp.AAC.1